MIPVWKKATTYPDAPHEYITAWTHYETYRAYQVRIREAGVEENFTLRGRTLRYRYFYEGNYKYWICGRILNRCRAARSEF